MSGGLYGDTSSRKLLVKYETKGDNLYSHHIIISLNINLFSPWYSWKIADLSLKNNHSLTVLPPLTKFHDKFPVYCHAAYVMIQ